MTKLTGDRCRCAACGLLFASTEDFDRHRVGRYGYNRRCRTAGELAAASWRQVDGLFWTRRPFRRPTAADRVRLRRRSPEAGPVAEARQGI